MYAHHAPALGIAERTGVQDGGDPVMAGAGQAGGSTHRHPREEAGGPPIERCHRTGTACLLGRRLASEHPDGRGAGTAVLSGMARVKRANLLAGCAVHDPCTEVGCAVGTRWTAIDPWGDFTAGGWLWFLAGAEVLPEPVPAVGRQFFWQWDAGDCRASP